MSLVSCYLRSSDAQFGTPYLRSAGFYTDNGYRVPFGGIHVFIGKIGEPGPELDTCTDIIEMAQRASPAQVQPAMKRVFVGFIHGAESEPVSDGETVIYSDGESSTGETESLYQLQDGRFGGYSDGDSISDPLEPPNRVAISMAGMQPMLQSSTVSAMISGSTAGQEAPRASRLKFCPVYWTPGRHY